MTSSIQEPASTGVGEGVREAATQDAEENSAFNNRAASARLPHTNGPWQSQHDFDWEGVCTIIGNIDGDPSSPTYTTICDIDEGCDEFLANRNLICAAPDMLSALRGALNALELFAEGDRSDEARKDAAKRAKIVEAAILKATGAQ